MITREPVRLSSPRIGRVALAVLLVLGGVGRAVLAAELDFTVGVLPVLTHAGCNSGACHGAASGQGGFKLSLLGYAPEQDYLALTRDLAGRRIDPLEPGASLLLRKATREIDHEGGRRLARDSAGARLLERWIAAGAPFGPRDLRVTSLQVEPAALFVERPAADTHSHPLRVTARLSDGTSVEVSALALYSSNDDAVAEVKRAGEVRSRGPGTTAIMVRFGGQVATAMVDAAYPTADPGSPGHAFQIHNFIDAAVAVRLKRLGVPASPMADGLEFLRRVHVDLAGRLPEPATVEDYLRQPDTPARRETVVDALLASEGFTDLWTQRLADLLLISGRRGSEASAVTYHRWLRDQVARDRPWDALARDLLTGAGKPEDNAPAGFALLAQDPRDLAEHAASIFLGTRLGCARCHAHPADRWTRTDYHQFAAYFARVNREGGRVQDTDRGEVEDPHTGVPLDPKPLGAAPPARDPGRAATSRRQEAAAWITHPDNPLFARAFVNRVWSHLFGQGLVEPVDDLRPTNPGPHPELLEALSRQFVADGFSLRRLVRLIVTSHTYQLSSRTLPGNATDDRLLSHARLKTPEGRVLLDLIAQATGVPEVFPDQPEARTALQLVGTQTPSPALDALGRCSRERACEPSGTAGGGLAQALHLINGSTLNRRLQAGHLPAWLALPEPDTTLVRRLYLATLSRPPRPEESAEWCARLASAGRRRETAEDLLWALLNSREFLFNH